MDNLSLTPQRDLSNLTNCYCSDRLEIMSNLHKTLSIKEFSSLDDKMFKIRYKYLKVAHKKQLNEMELKYLISIVQLCLLEGSLNKVNIGRFDLLPKLDVKSALVSDVSLIAQNIEDLERVLNLGVDAEWALNTISDFYLM